MTNQMMKPVFWKTVPALFAVTLALASAAFAGPLEDANRAYRSGDYQTAATLSQQAVKEDPLNPTGYVALGTCLHKLGDNTGARNAWDNLLRLDPQLTSVKNHAGFQKAYAEVGGDPSRVPVSDTGNAAPADPARGNSDANAIISALSTGNVYVHPDLANDVDGNAVNAATQSVAPTVVKVVVVPKLGGYPSREALADALSKQLNLGENGAIIVATPAGVSAYCTRLSDAQVDEAFQNAGLAAAFAQGGLNQALPIAVKAFSTEVTTDRRDDSNRSGALAILAVAVVGGGLGLFAMKRKKQMDAAKAPIETLRQDVIKNLSYVDGYLDLLPKGDEADRAKRFRAAAYANFATATGLMHAAKRPEELHQPQTLLQSALAELVECRQDIDRATGGTGVAMAAPDIPDLATDATQAQRFQRVEALRSRDQAERLQRDIQSIPESQRGVSFFSGQPMPKDALVPVSIVIGGQKRTVMATRDEAAQILRGETPAVRAFPDDSGHYIPWYENRGYDPYRDYYGGYGSGLGTFVDLMLLSHLFGGGGFFGGYGGWGGWGYEPVVINNYYDGYNDPMNSPGGFGGIFGGGNDGGQQVDPAPEHSGGFDFFGQGGYNEQSNDGGFGNDSNDSGGGFDFGGGGDSGGGDSGGGDFGGGDFGGGGDSSGGW